MPLKLGQPGIDPRTIHHRHKERGPKRHVYTLPEVAEAAGYSQQYIKNRGSSYHTVEDAARVIMRGQHRRRFPRLSVEALELVFGEGYSKWANRYPVLHLYACPECGLPTSSRDLLFEPDFCDEHGGCRDHALGWSNSGYIAITTDEGRRIPWHRLTFPRKRGYVCHHKDGNKWNNRPENLELLTKEEHSLRHRFPG